MKTAAQICDENSTAHLHKREMSLWLRLLAAFLVLSLSANILLGYAAFYRFPIKSFLWISDARAACDAIPLSEPNMSQARLKNLASSAAVELNSYDYANWRVLINSALDQRFTPRGRDLYRAALQESGIIERVVEGYHAVSAVTIAPPNIAEEGRRSGRYYWTVEVPLRIFYRSNVQTKAENRLLTMTIIRIDPSPLNTNGVAIDAMQSSQLISTHLPP